MPLPEQALPVRMRRVAVVLLRERVREALVAMAELGAFDLAGPLGSGEGPALETLRRLESGRGRSGGTVATLAREAPDIGRLELEGARDVLAGEVELERRRSSAVTRGSFALFVGWAPSSALADLAERLAPLGGELIELPTPRGQRPPTLLAPSGVALPFRPLLDTYGAIPYDDVDPTPFVAFTYSLMFGMMFGDLGDGLLILAAALVLRRTRSTRLAGLRRIWPMLAAPGAAGAVFGILYGEFFGPTRIVPALWLSPLDSPTRLLAAAIVVGGVLLAAGHAIGIVNRWREGGASLALTTLSGLPGLALLLGGGGVALGVVEHSGALRLAGVALAAAAAIPLAIGLGREAGGGSAAEVGVGLLDALLRTVSNAFSFSRLAAFGLTHAALAKVVLDAAGGMGGTPLGDVGAVAVFALGSAAAFALEALVVAVQALRLEYYELFSRVFAREGRPFRPWRLPLKSIEEA